MRFEILIGLLVFISAPAFALEVSEYHADASVVDGGLDEEVTLELYNNKEEPLTQFMYPFSGKLQNIQVSDSEGGLKHSVRYVGEKTYVTTTLRRPIYIEGTYAITYRFYLDGQVTQKEGTYILSTSHSLLANVKNFYFTIAIPEGYGVVDQGVSPKPEEIKSDGRRVILEWRFEEPIPSVLREFNAIVLYENLLGGILPMIRGFEGYIYPLAIVAILAISFYFYRRFKKGHAAEKINILKENEQAVMRLIVDKEGIDQREIQRETDFSKTKVSKILSELEKRGVVRKEQMGRRNKIFLTEKFRER